MVGMDQQSAQVMTEVLTTTVCLHVVYVPMDLA